MFTKLKLTMIDKIIILFPIKNVIPTLLSLMLIGNAWAIKQYIIQELNEVTAFANEMYVIKFTLLNYLLGCFDNIYFLKMQIVIFMALLFYINYSFMEFKPFLMNLKTYWV